MIYLNNKISGVENPKKQTFASQSLLSLNNGAIMTDYASFPNYAPVKNKPKKKNNNFMRNLVGGLALTTAIVFACAKLRKGKGASNAADTGKDIVESTKNEGKKVADNIEKKVSAAQKQEPTSISELESKITEINMEQQAKKVDLQQKPNIFKNPSEMELHISANKTLEKSVEKQTQIVQQTKNPKGVDKVNSQKCETSINELESQVTQINKEQQVNRFGFRRKPITTEYTLIKSEAPPYKQTNELTEKTVEKQTQIASQQKMFKLADKVNSSAKNEQVDRAFSKYAQKISKDINLEDKQELIREVLPDLMIIKDVEALKDVLKHVTVENKDFVTKVAVPSIMRNANVLDLEKVMGPILKIITPDTVDCLDKMAANAQRFNIKSNVDTQLLLEALSKYNKDFAFKEVLSYLSDNADKFKISSAGDMAGYIDVITSQNKNFMFNEAIPTIIKNMDRLHIKANEVPIVAKNVTKSNLKNIEKVAEDMNQFNAWIL